MIVHEKHAPPKPALYRPTPSKLLCSIAIWAIFSACTYQPQAKQFSKPPWRYDCVGRIKISFPGDVDISAILPDDMLRGLMPPRIRPDSVFLDGQTDGYSQYQINGELLITHPINTKELASLKMQFDKNTLEAKKNLEELAQAENKTKPEFAILATSSADEVAHRIGAAISAFKRIGNSAVEWRNFEQDSDIKQAVSRNLQNFHLFEGARSRSIFDVPTEIGLCAPYLFMPDNGSSKHFISATFRLKNHPDITIWLHDSSIELDSLGAARDQTSTVYDNKLFWTAKYQGPKKYRQIFIQATKIAGMNGVSSFMQLTRDDGTIDYGYFASARGDAAKEPSPTNVQMFVIRDAKNALAKGIQPMGKNEFLKMAQTIAASVQKRPIETR